jgi:hypothetical protein
MHGCLHSSCLAGQHASTHGVKAATTVELQRGNTSPPPFAAPDRCIKVPPPLMPRAGAVEGAHGGVCRPALLLRPSSAHQR